MWVENAKIMKKREIFHKSIIRFIHILLCAKNKQLKFPQFWIFTHILPWHIPWYRYMYHLVLFTIFFSIHSLSTFFHHSMFLRLPHHNMWSYKIVCISYFGELVYSYKLLKVSDLICTCHVALQLTWQPTLKISKFSLKQRSNAT